MKKKFLITTAFFLLLFLPNLNAQNEIKLDVPVDSWAPFRIVEENKNHGIDFDLINEIKKRTNIEFTYKKYPWSRSLIYMKNGRTDLMSGLAKRVEREEYIKYTSTPYYTCSTVFYVHKGNQHLIKTYDDLKNHLVGYVANSAYFAPFDTDTNLNKRAVTNESQLIEMLAVGRIKVMIGTDCQADYDIKQQGYSGKFEKALYKPNNQVHLYIGLSKKSPNIKEFDLINKTIKNIVEEGLVKEFAKKYYE